MAFDPSRLVELARQQASEFPNLPALLATCTRAAWDCRAYARFTVRPEAAGTDDAAPHAGLRCIGGHSVLLEADEDDYVLDLSAEGVPIGVELLREASSARH